MLLKLTMSGWHRGDLRKKQAAQHRLTRWAFVPPGITREPVQIGGLPAEWIRPENPSGTILYLHGGAFVLGSIGTHRMLAVDLTRHTGMQVILPEYRLAPDHPFPAAMDDAARAYAWLLASGIPPREIILGGDSAGGGLALSMLVRLQAEGQPIPAAAFLLSPWTDLTLSGASIEAKASTDPVLSQEPLRRFARMYAAGHDLHDPYISPLGADLSGLPPILVQVGTEEILLDDAVRLAESLTAAGGTARLEVYPGMFHVFQMMPFLPETRQAFSAIAQFCRETLPPIR